MNRQDSKSTEIISEDTRHTLTGIVNSLQEVPQLASAFQLQLETLDKFYGLARTIGGNACPIEPLAKNLLDLEHNFFSMLFLAVTRAIVADSTHMPLYGMVNQGMRAWVTACDNLLDDEYKAIFRFEAAGDGNRMRSVLTLLLADRVIFEYICKEYGDCDLVARVGRISLAALMPSAIQESKEELRPVQVLSPEELLHTVHQQKTADLFTATLAVPATLEHIESARLDAAKQAVANFGLACQILDDLKDMQVDIIEGRHNYLVSTISAEQGTGWLTEQRNGPIDSWDSWERFPANVAAARLVAQGLFTQAFEDFAAIGLDLSTQLQDGIVELMYLILQVSQE